MQVRREREERVPRTGARRLDALSALLGFQTLDFRKELTQEQQLVQGGGCQPPG